MAKYLYRSCPKCGDYLGVVVPEPPRPVAEIPIDATGLRCGYRLAARKIIVSRKSPSTALGSLFLVFVLTSIAYPHGGGLDAYGCHYNRKAGGYHCHRGPLAGQSFSSQEEMLQKFKSKEVKAKEIPRKEVPAKDVPAKDVTSDKTIK